MGERGRCVEDCTKIEDRHQGAQWASPLRLDLSRRGGADEVPACF